MFFGDQIHHLRGRAMLTASQKGFFADNGYLVVEDVFDRDSILEPVRTEYARLLDDLIKGWVAAGELESLPDGLDFFARLKHCYAHGLDWFQPLDISLPGDQIRDDTPMHFGPAVFSLITAPKLLDIVECLIGPEITSNPIQHVRLKPPAPALRSDEIRPHITYTDWHQDRGVAHDEADQTDMVTVWVAMNDATEENGCLQVLPQKRDTGLLPHCTKIQTAIADGFIDAERAVPLPVRAGGIVMFHPLTPHSSLANTSSDFRWSFDIRFNRTGQPTGRSHFPSFVARSRRAPASELRDWRRWKASWEEARSRLSETPHIPIHRWTSDAPFCA